MSENTALVVEPTPASLESREASRFWFILLIVTVLVGAACRLRQVLANPSFWADEAFIVMNLLELSYRGLLNQLHHGQAAPPLFLWIEKAVMNLAGVNEYALRMLPLLCGIGSLVFYAVAVRRLLTPPLAVIALAMLALCERLIGYSAEVKQYSGDVMISTLLLMLATTPRRSALQRLVPIACVAAMLAWMSHPTALVFGGVSIFLSLEILRSGRARDIAIAFACNILVVASFATLYFVSIRLENTNWMHHAWHEDFPDYSHPTTIPGWILRESWEFLASPYRMVGPLLVIAFFMGIGNLLWQKKFNLLLLLTAPLILSILSAFMQKYPFNSSRLTLFLLPQVFILCALGFDALRLILPPKLKSAWILAPATVIGIGVAQDAVRFVKPHFRSHIRPAAAYVRQHRAPGEGLYLTGVPGNIDPDPTVGRHLELLCYWQKPDPPVHTLLPRDWHQVPERRFWVVFAFHPDKESDWRQTLLNEARQVADEKDHFVDPRGGAAYLFEKR